MPSARRVTAVLYSDGSWEHPPADWVYPPVTPNEDDVRPGVLEVALLASPNTQADVRVLDLDEVVKARALMSVGGVETWELPSGAYVIHAVSVDGVTTHPFRQVIAVLPGTVSSLNISIKPAIGG